MKRPELHANNSKNLLAVTALLFAVLFWGGSFAGMRIALKVLDPYSVMWIRMVVALIMILPFAGKIIPDNYIKGDWKLLIPMVLFQPCLYFLMESNALLYTTSTQAGVISASVPVLVALGAWIYLSEPINRVTIFGLLLSIAGVISLTVTQDSESMAQNPILGNMLETLAMVFAAANMVIIKKLSTRYNPWSLTAMQILGGTLFFLPGLFKIINMDSSVWTRSLILNLIYLGAFVSFGAFGLYNWGMSRISAAKASSYINLIPVTAILTGWIILGETLNLLQSVSTAIVIAGVLITQRSHRNSNTKLSV